MQSFFVFVFLCTQSIDAFSNRFVSEWIGLGYSHGGITDRAIHQVAFEYCNVTTEAEFLKKLPIDLWLRHVSVVDQIDQYNDNMDNDPGTKNRPMYHFDAERFVRANQWLLDTQQAILDAIQSEHYDLAREYLGKALHTHQDFYSHSNWIEMGENRSYPWLGELDAFHDNVATINMSTCLNCTRPCATCDYHCRGNILPHINEQRIFTSGYYVGEVEDDQPVPKPTNVMKCSHGGIIDKTQEIPAVGGINKDVKASLLSPHDYDQERAANVAIQSSYLFLRKLWHLTGTTDFGRLLELISLNQSTAIVLNRSDHRSAVQRLTEANVAKGRCFIYDLSNDLEPSPEILSFAQRKQCRVYSFDSEQEIIEFHRVSTSSSIRMGDLIFTVHSVPPGDQVYRFSIDRSIRTLRLFVRTKSKIDLQLSRLFVSPDASTIEDRWELDSSTMKIAALHQPKPGAWLLKINGSVIRTFELTAITSISFVHSFSRLNLNLTHPGLYALDTEPMQCDHLHSSIRILAPHANELFFYRLEFLNRSNRLLSAFPLTRQSSIFYTSRVQIPSEHFHLRIVGYDRRTGERIERMYGHRIIPRTVDIRVVTATGAAQSIYLEPGESSRINYTLLGDDLSQRSIQVSIIPSNALFHLETHADRFEGSILLRAPSNQTRHIGHSSEISIFVHAGQRATFASSYSVQAMIRSPSSVVKPFLCPYSFPTNRTVKDACFGPIETCSSRHWDLMLHLTETPRIHSLILTYYDSADLLDSNKKTVVYRLDRPINDTMELMLSPNSCCYAFVDLVAYDHQGHRVSCLPFTLISNL